MSEKIGEVWPNVGLLRDKHGMAAVHHDLSVGRNARIENGAPLANSAGVHFFMSIGHRVCD